MRAWLERIWWDPAMPPVWLRLAGKLYCLVMQLRRRLYRLGILRSAQVPVPVIVIGNITVGGSGKTPLVIWLARGLRDRGFQPGIVSRGYGGKLRSPVQEVRDDSDPAEVGDEPVLVAAESGCPVVVSRSRSMAAKRLLERGCNLVIADDGLQHYRLRRDVEIAVVDGARRYGNGHCLPAGPLRELQGRLAETDFVVCNGMNPRQGEWAMELEPAQLVPMAGQSEAPAPGTRVHGAAGIGNPWRFFETLRQQGYEVVEHPFPDHHRFTNSDLQFEDGAPVIMTAKDAVKCRGRVDARFWYLPVTARPAAGLIDAIEERLRDANGGQEAA